MEQPELLRKVIESLESLGIPYMVVGSIASGAYGEPRMTQDIDIVIDIQPEQVSRFCAEFTLPDFYISRDAVEQAIRHRSQFNVIHPSSGNKVDFMIARSDVWGRTQLARRQRVQILPDRPGYVARPEDIILGKMLYYQEGGSEKHLRDIAGILKISGDQLDREYVQQWAGQLDLMEIWQSILRRVGQQ